MMICHLMLSFLRSLCLSRLIDIHSRIDSFELIHKFLDVYANRSILSYVACAHTSVITAVNAQIYAVFIVRL